MLTFLAGPTKAAKVFPTTLWSQICTNVSRVGPQHEYTFNMDDPIAEPLIASQPVAEPLYGGYRLFKYMYWGKRLLGLSLSKLDISSSTSDLSLSNGDYHDVGTPMCHSYFHAVVHPWTFWEMRKGSWVYFQDIGSPMSVQDMILGL